MISVGIWGNEAKLIKTLFRMSLYSCFISFSYMMHFALKESYISLGIFGVWFLANVVIIKSYFKYQTEKANLESLDGGDIKDK